MDFIKLTCSLLIHLSLAGELHVNDVVLHKPHNFAKAKNSLEFDTDRPRSLDKRSRILKFGKYDHAGRCIFGKCDERLELQFTPTFKDELTVEEFQPKSAQFSSQKESVHYDRVEESLIESKIIFKVNSKLEQELNYYTTKTEVVSEEQKLTTRRDREERIVRRDVKSSVSTQLNNSSSQTPQEAVNSTEKTKCIPTIDGGNKCDRKNESRLPYDLDGDSYMAFGSLGFLLLVLTSAVLYTGLWKKRNTMLYPDFIDQERPSSSRRKTDIKALLKAKLGKIPVRSRRIKERLGKHRNHNNRYLTLPLVLNGEAGLPDDESDDSEENRISEEEEEESAW